MSEEEVTQVKISMPLIDDIELQRIDTFYNDIVSEYTKAFVKEKEQVIIQRLMMNLQQENTQLKKRVDMYENPEDLTLMFMYCDEKAKDKIKHLTSVLKEIREYIKENSAFMNDDEWEVFNKKEILEIIDKGIGEDK